MDAISKTADFVAKSLKQRGFIIQKYDSRTTNSIYLKLDYGASNGIRFSDHSGKKKYLYRYNVSTEYNAVRAELTKEGWERNYYPISAAENLIADIVDAKLAKLEKYGEKGYQTMMRRNKEAGECAEGFWKFCVEI